MKNKIIISLGVIGIAFATMAATTIGVLPNANQASAVLNSTSGSTNIVAFPYWPTTIGAASSVTNFTAIDISQVRDVSLQFVCQATNASTVSNVVWTVYRSANSAAVTNAVGTGVSYDTLGYVTNVLSGVTPVVAIANYTTLNKTAPVGYQSTDPGIAGIRTLYIGQVAVAANCGLTNYQVYVSGK